MENLQTETTQLIQEEKQFQTRKTKQKRVKKLLLSLLCFSLFFLLTTIYSQYQLYILKKLDAANELLHPAVPVTPNQIVEAVSKHILLPDSIPKIATIQDAQKLSSTQPLFKDVVNGDVVLVYETTIIVYRPAQDILVVVGNITGTEK